jgi:hypothetical protein
LGKALTQAKKAALLLPGRSLAPSKNDLFYTNYLFKNQVNCKTHFESRLLFSISYPMKKYTFAQSLNLGDQKLGITYLSEKFRDKNGGNRLPKKPPFNDKIEIQDFKFNQDYPNAFPIYSQKFEKVNSLKKTEENDAENFRYDDLEGPVYLNLSVGGLHSSWKEPKEICCFIIESTDFIWFFDIDAESFYGMILFKILFKIQEMELHDSMKTMGDQRNKLKKEKNPFN